VPEAHIGTVKQALAQRIWHNLESRAEREAGEGKTSFLEPSRSSRETIETESGRVPVESVSIPPVSRLIPVVLVPIPMVSIRIPMESVLVLVESVRIPVERGLKLLESDLKQVAHE
jgi:hypothetical protein